jgi:hypothetical protein
VLIICINFCSNLIWLITNLLIFQLRRSSYKTIMNLNNMYSSISILFFFAPCRLSTVVCLNKKNYNFLRYNAAYTRYTKSKKVKQRSKDTDAARTISLVSSHPRAIYRRGGYVRSAEIRVRSRWCAPGPCCQIQ